VDALLDGRRSLRLLELPLDALDHVGADRAHVVSNVRNAVRLQKRDERLVVQAEVASDLVNPELLAHPASV
jgi:hypothetical protein